MSKILLPGNGCPFTCTTHLKQSEYRNLPIKGTSPNRGILSRGPKTAVISLIIDRFSSSEPQPLPYDISIDLAITPDASVRQITVREKIQHV